MLSKLSHYFPNVSLKGNPQNSPSVSGSIAVRDNALSRSHLSTFLSGRQARRMSRRKSGEDKSITRDIIAIVFATSVPEPRSWRKGVAGRYRVVGEVVDLANLYGSLSFVAVYSSWSTPTPAAGLYSLSRIIYQDRARYTGCR